MLNLASGFMCHTVGTAWFHTVHACPLRPHACTAFIPCAAEPTVSYSRRGGRRWPGAQALLWAPTARRCRCPKTCPTRTCACSAARSTTAPWPSSAAASAAWPAPTSAVRRSSTRAASTTSTTASTTRAPRASSPCPKRATRLSRSCTRRAPSPRRAARLHSGVRRARGARVQRDMFKPFLHQVPAQRPQGPGAPA